MAKIKVRADCGNAPKSEFLKEFNMAMAQGDTDFISRHLAVDMVWEIMGKQKVTGVGDLLRILPGYPLWKAKELVIDTVITHGKEASASGRFTSRDNREYAYCEIYRFKGFKGTILSSIETFLISL